MRQIGTVASESDAARLESYLLTVGIKSQHDPVDQGWAIWVYDEDRVADAKREIDLFLQNPADPRYAAAERESRRLRAESARRDERLRRNVIDVRSRWARPALARRPVTFALIVISGAVAFLTQFGDSDASPTSKKLIAKLSIASYETHGNEITWKYLSEIRHGEIWRLITPIFLHFNVLHLFFNMYLLSQLGSMIEFNRGPFRLLLIVLVVSVASNLGQYLMKSPAFGGMSGVDYGLFGYVWMKGRYDPESGMGLHSNTVIIMLGWLVLCMLGTMGPIANWAHGVGLLAGMLLGYAPLLWRRSRV